MSVAYGEASLTGGCDRESGAAGMDMAVAAARSGEVPVQGYGAPAEAYRAMSAESVRSGLDDLLMARHPDVGLEVLLDTGCIRAMFPELLGIVGFGDGESHKDVWRHTKQVVLQSVPRLAVRWSALLHDIGKPRTRSVGRDGQVHFFHHAEEGARMFERMERRMGLFATDPKLKEGIQFLILQHQRAHQYEEEWTDSAVRRFGREIGDSLDDLMALSRADMTTKRRDKRRRFLFQLKDLQDRIEDLSAKDAKVASLPKGLGDALMQEFGLKPSRQLGDLRKALEQDVEEGHVAGQQTFDVYIEYIRRDLERFGLA